MACIGSGSAPTRTTTAWSAVESTDTNDPRDDGADPISQLKWVGRLGIGDGGEREAGAARHGSEIAVERLAQEGLLQFLQGGEFAFVKAGEVLGFGMQAIDMLNNVNLLIKGWQIDR